MAMRLHEIHSSTIHFPLGLLPAAAGFDLAAALTGSKALARTGSQLWWAGSLSGLFTGLAGLAASQEVKTYEKRTEDAMLVHGLANTAVTLAAIGLSTWRLRHRPSIASAIVGLGACGVAVWTAYLGGEMVYSRGVGVKTAGGIHDSPEVLSRRAPGRFFGDAAKGLGWALREGAKIFSGQRPLEPVMQVSAP